MAAALWRQCGYPDELGVLKEPDDGARVSPRTPALLPTKLPRLVTLLRMVLRRTLKLGDLKACLAVAVARSAAFVGWVEAVLA